MAAVTLSPDVRARIAQLLPTLSSDQAGEVAATAAAIGRVLKGAGADWHDFAIMVKGSITIIAHETVTQANAWRAPRAPTPPRQPMPPRWPGENESDYRARAHANDAYAPRTKAQFRSQRGQKPPIKGEVWSVELREAIDDIERVQGGSLDGLGERAFTFLEQLRDRACKFDIVRVSPKQDRWLRSIAKDNGVNVPWDEIEDDGA